MNAGALGHAFIIAAPSGTGKTTVCRELLQCDPKLRFSVSYTTRPRREKEREGVDYHFISAEDFRRRVDEMAFLEHAEYGGNLYGTSAHELQSALNRGEDVLLEIEVQGALQVRERRPDACFIFLLPPSMAVLEQRLRDRGTDSLEVIDRRLALADRELAVAHIFDFAVINDDLATCVEGVQKIIAAIRNGRAASLLECYGQQRVLARWWEVTRASSCAAE